MKPELYDYVDKKIKEVVRSHGSHLRRAVYDIMVHNYSLEKVGSYDDYFRKHRNYWTLETCKVSALKYSSKFGWQKNEVGAYQTALRNNWMDECCQHMEEVRKPHLYWTLERCKESALNYSTRSEWKKGETSAYQTALRNNWMDECCSHMEEVRKPHGYWTLETCKESALNYSTRKEWQKGEVSAYQTAHKNNWLDECCSHMEAMNNFWTLEKCKSSALNYSTRNEWTKNESGAYKKALENNWMDECCSHMEEVRKPHGYWTLETCKESAINYSTRSEWKKGEGGAYHSAQKNNWLDECCQHMEGRS